MSVIAECVLSVGAAAPRTAAAAAAATTIETAEMAAVEAAGMGTAPPPRPHTETAVAGMEDAAMVPAPTRMTSIRITTTAAAAASTAALGLPLLQGGVEWGRPHLPHRFLSL